jgi:hypothetical protein
LEAIAASSWESEGSGFAEVSLPASFDMIGLSVDPFLQRLTPALSEATAMCRFCADEIRPR